MNRVALLIGGNQGDRRALIQQATALIQERIGTVAAASSIYETAPWGEFEVESGERRVESGEWRVESGEWRVENFLNQALVVETPLTAHEVLHEAQEIERQLGRVRKEGSKVYSSRPMDIDIIFFNDEVIESKELTVPHPRMHLREFVLAPLTEVMPDYRHPVLGKTIEQLRNEL